MCSNLLLYWCYSFSHEFWKKVKGTFRDASSDVGSHFCSEYHFCNGVLWVCTSFVQWFWTELDLKLFLKCTFKWFLLFLTICMIMGFCCIFNFSFSDNDPSNTTLAVESHLSCEYHFCLFFAVSRDSCGRVVLLYFVLGQSVVLTWICFRIKNGHDKTKTSKKKKTDYHTKVNNNVLKN